MPRSPPARSAAERDFAAAERLWAALGRADAAAMAACYAPDARFEDPVFRLQGRDEVAAMWSMLLGGARDLRIRPGPLVPTPEGAEGTWEATYTFTGTGRQVRNRIRSRLVLRDGLVVSHADAFPFWRWSRQALGVKGLVAGWTPLVRNAVRRQAARRLERFRAASSGPGSATAP